MNVIPLHGVVDEAEARAVLPGLERAPEHRHATLRAEVRNGAGRTQGDVDRVPAVELGAGLMGDASSEPLRLATSASPGAPPGSKHHVELPRSDASAGAGAGAR